MKKIENAISSLTLAVSSISLMILSSRIDRHEYTILAVAAVFVGAAVGGAFRILILNELNDKKERNI